MVGSVRAVTRLWSITLTVPETDAPIRQPTRNECTHRPLLQKDYGLGSVPSTRHSFTPNERTMNNDPFNNDFFKNHNRTVRTGFRVFGAVWIISLLVSLVGIVAIVCVAWHFISKFW